MPSEGGYNVLLILSDRHNRNVTGCYGDPLVRTPDIGSLEERCIAFTRAYASSQMCGPYRTALLTGMHVHSCGVWHHGFMSSRTDVSTLAEVSRRYGYVTAAIGELHAVGEGTVDDLRLEGTRR